MQVKIYLIVFTVDDNSTINKYVLIYKNDIMSEVMSDSSPNSLTIIEDMVKDSMGITGRWIDIQPKLVGILDEPEYITADGDRYIALVYSLYIQGKNSLKSRYGWIPLNEIENSSMSDITKGVIRYAATHI